MSARPVPDGRPGCCVLVLAAVLLSGCSTSDYANLPKELGGLPADAPQRPADPPAYPGVFETPPPRSAALLDAEQQKRLEADLTAIGNRQAKSRTGSSSGKGSAALAAKPKRDRAKPAKRPQNEATTQRGASGPAASGTPPWPVPPQTTGGSQRP
ncbi:MAG: hypothetical protein ACO1NY_13535 [Pseudorhodoplanes sp.]